MNAPWNAHRVTVFAGQHDTHIATGEDYKTRTLASIFAMEPTCRPKMQEFAFIPSSYNGHDARCHKVQEQRGEFVALCVDIDSGNLSLAHVEGLMRAFVGEAAWLIVSTAHARPGNMRWRGIVPLAVPALFADWYEAQLAFFAHFETAGVMVDRALKGAGQPVFLPNVPRVHGKTGQGLRGADHAPLHYVSSKSGIDNPGLDLHSGAVAIGIALVRKEHADKERDQQRIRVEAAARRARQPISTTGSIIAEFDKATPITILLEMYGYEQSRRNPADWRSPHQTSGSYATKVDGDRWVSLSGSDASASVGRQCASGVCGDAYDLFVHYDHGGDHRAAFRQLQAERKGGRPMIERSAA